MSVYTTELRYIVDTWTAAPPGSSIEQKITGALPKIFNFTFPIWDETYRQALEFKIVQHFYMREIGFETVGLWQFYLRRALMDKMPYFNELYQTVAQDFNFLAPYNITESIVRDITGQGTSNQSTQQDVTGTVGDTTEGSSSTTSSNSRDITTTNTTEEHRQGSDEGSQENNSLVNELPQTVMAQPKLDFGTSSTNTTATDSRTTTGTVTGTQTEARKDDYEESTATENKQTVSGTNENHLTGSSDSGYNDTRKENITNTRTGNPGLSYGKLIQEYREALINIDLLVCESLDDLFFGLWA